MAKKKTGRTSAVSKKRSGSARARRSTGRARAVRAPKPSGHELVPVICSECFEEFAYDTGVKSDSLTCPVCEHSAQRPDDGVLHRISTHRKTEKTNFIIAFALLMVGVLAFAAWIVLIRNPANAADDTMFWGPLGVAIVCALGLAGFMFKYEANRWEFYF